MTAESLDLALGRGRICAHCSQPCRGSASILQGGETKYYCHPNEVTRQDCYHVVTVGKPLRGFIELLFDDEPVEQVEMVPVPPDTGPW